MDEVHQLKDSEAQGHLGAKVAASSSRADTRIFNRLPEAQRLSLAIDSWNLTEGVLFLSRPR